MDRQEYKTGLWKRESQKGTKYYSGKLKIGDKEYQVTLFNNQNKKNDSSPDLNLILKDFIKKGQEKKSYTTDEIVYANFGEEVNEIDDSEIAF